MTEPISLWLLTAHMLGDFPFQPQWMSEMKIDEVGTRFIHCSIHAFLFVPIAWVALIGVSQFVFVGWIFASHFIIDSRRWVEPKEGWGERWVWLMDQIMHLTALSLSLPVAGLF